MTGGLTDLMASLTTTVPYEIHRYILEYLVDENTEQTIHYALVSNVFCNIVRDVVLSRISAAKTNPYLIELYGDILLWQENFVLASLIKYSYNQNDSSAIFYFIRTALCSSESTEKLCAKSVQILKKFINDKKFVQKIQKATGITVKNALFPIVYEYGVSNLDKMDTLELCSKYFKNPSKIVFFLLYAVPRYMENYLIPFDENEKKRLIEIMRKGEFKLKASLFGVVTVLYALLYAGYISVHEFDLNHCLLLLLDVSILLFLLAELVIFNYKYNISLPVATDSEDQDDNDPIVDTQ